MATVDLNELRVYQLAMRVGEDVWSFVDGWPWMAKQSVGLQWIRSADSIAANIADSALLGFDACFPDSVVGFVPFAPIPDARYFEYFMRTAQSNLEQFAPSTAQKNINLGILDELLIPLPPVEEMRRIVEHVEALMGLCDTLEHGLLSRDSAASRLAARSTNAIAG